ncbi:hypothetical protein [Exiguobacterium sp. s142]|uniref:TlpA family protein disulfide reductase n=1 Tax=Exiguobacterium sp. s142 TaxID=2751222 RepID=UPI001BE6FF56|nr:hypothetical protein [Exiguobacterium sp. s142]
MILYIMISIIVIFIGYNVFNTWGLIKKINLFFDLTQKYSLFEYVTELQIGHAAPIFHGKDQFNNAITNEKNQEMLLIFITPTCPVCKNIINELSKNDYPKMDFVNMVFISRGPIEQNHIDVLSSFNVSYLNSIKTVDLFNIRSVPKGIWIDRNNIIVASESLNTIQDVLSMKKVG